MQLYVRTAALRPHSSEPDSVGALIEFRCVFSLLVLEILKLTPPLGGCEKTVLIGTATVGRRTLLRLQLFDTDIQMPHSCGMKLRHFLRTRDVDVIVGFARKAHRLIKIGAVFSQQLGQQLQCALTTDVIFMRIKHALIIKHLLAQ